MDKHGKTITIKINGKDRPVKGDKQNRESNNQKKNDQEETIGKVEYDKEPSVSYPINENHEGRSKVYPLDNEAALNESAAAQEKTEESFDWILPDPIEQETVKEYKIAPKQAKKQKKSIDISVWNKKGKRNNRLFTTIFATVFFAVLLGTAFGVTFLKFVAPDTETVAPVATPATAAPDTGKSEGGNEAIELKSIPVFIVQNGVFTTEDAAKERINLLDGQGVKSELFPVEGKFAVYLATAGGIEDAKQQAQSLEAKGVEVFAKPFEIPGGKATGLAADEAKFLQQAPEIYSILMSGSQASPESVKKAEEYQALLGKMADKNVKDPKVLKAKASMENATSSFMNYQKNKDANQLAEMEKNLLSFLSAYQSIGK